MTLFGLLWAAFLPNHLLPVNQLTPLTLQTANPYAAVHSQRQKAVDLSTSSYSPLHQQAPAHRPLQLYPQLTWPQAAAVDWYRWATTASVAVVAQGTVAHVSSAVPQIAPGSGVCGDYSTASPKATPGGFTIQVNSVAIGQVPSRPAADQVANQLRQAVPILKTNPDGLLPSLGRDQAAGQVNGKTLFVLPTSTRSQGHQPSPPADAQTALQASQWINNLRLAYGGSPLDPSQVQMAAYGLGETHHTFNGTASWYGPYFHGRPTATGETFNQNELTAAHKTLPFGTYLQVRNQLNGRTVVVRINDRGPYVG